MSNKYTILFAIILFISLGYLSRIMTEGFYDPTKEDQRPFGVDDHSYDGDLYQAEKIIFDRINELDSKKINIKEHLGELLNILQFI
jgi:hypothetical protein